jgi:hypothetical protein
VLVATLTVAMVALVRSRGHPTAITSVAGAVAILTPLTFWASAALGDLRLIDLLTRRATELKMITGQFGYRIPSARLTGILFVPLTGRWRLVGVALQPGWLLTLCGGVLLGLAGCRPLAALSRRWPWRTGVALLIVLIAITAMVGRGYDANRVARAAFTAEHAGDYRLEVQRFRRAEQLNPTLRLRADIEQALGTAFNLTGQTMLPQALEATAEVHRAGGQLDLAVEDLAAAHATYPDDLVIYDDYRATALSVARHENRPDFLIPLLKQPPVDALPVRYTLGRVLYAIRRYDDAMVQLDWVVTHTGNKDVISSALTYIALCQKGAGDEDAARTTLLHAIAKDSDYANLTARDLAAGLFIPVQR